MSSATSSSRDSDLGAALCAAARSGECDRMRDLIKLGANVLTARNPADGTTPLMAAVIGGHMDALNMLLVDAGKKQTRLEDNVRRGSAPGSSPV
jgi:hypothetical protein